MSQFPPNPGHLQYPSFPPLPPASLRPAAVTTVAVLGIVFGSLSLLGALCGIGTSAFYMAAPASTYSAPGGATGAPQPFNGLAAQAKVQRDPAVATGTISLGVINLILSGLEVTAAILALKLRETGRRLMIAFAIATIPEKIAAAIFQSLVVMPKLMAAQNAFLGGAPPGFAASQKLMMGMGIFFLLLTMAWPIVILVIFSQQGIKEAFKTTPQFGRI